jgi:hypothetical protein
MSKAEVKGGEEFYFGRRADLLVNWVFRTSCSNIRMYNCCC